jgi:hypothetical protein
MKRVAAGLKRAGEVRSEMAISPRRVSDKLTRAASAALCLCGNISRAVLHIRAGFQCHHFVLKALQELNSLRLAQEVAASTAREKRKKQKRQ